jgi:hypothetical protein
MFKKIFIAITVFTMCSTGNVWANQLLINDGFENGIVTGWTQFGPNWEGQSTTVFQGAISAKNVITTIAGFDYFATLKQEFTASVGQTYYATAQAKTIFSTQSSSRAGVQIDFLDGSNNPIGTPSKDEIGGGTDWKLLYATRVAPANTAKVRYTLFVFAPLAETQSGGIALGGAGYFDNAVLSTDFIPPPSVTSLSNDGFENGFSSWTVQPPGWSAQNSIVFEGNLSAKNVISDLGSVDYFRIINQDINASVSQTFYATLQAKTAINPLSSAVAGLEIDFLNSGGSVIPGFSVQDKIGGNTDWTQLYVKATAPAGTAKVRFKPFVFATQVDSNQTSPTGPAFGGQAFFDNAVLTTNVINPPSTPIALVNAGFENGLNDWTTPFSPVVADNTDVSSGALSAKTTINNSTQDYFSPAYQDLDYQSGTVYAAADIKTNLTALSTAVGAIKIECFDVANPGVPGVTIPTCAVQQNTTVTNGWKKVVTSVVPPVGTVTIRVSVLAFATLGEAVSNGKIVRFDNVLFSYDPIPGTSINTNLINSGFESGLANWNDLFGFPAQTDDTTVFAGSVAAKKTIGVAVVGQDYFSQVYQDVYFNAAGANFPTNTQIWATAQVKTAINPVTLSIGGLLMEFVDSSGTVIGTALADTIGGQTDWRKLFVTGNTPAGTQRVRISGIQYALASEASLGGDTYYDDFVYSVTPLDPSALNKKLQNTGFENGLTDWDIENQPGAVSNTVKFSGSLAAQFTINNAILDPGGIDYFGSAAQTLDISQDGLLTLRARVVNAKIKAKTQINLTTLASAAFRVDFFDENDDFIIGYVSNSIGGNTDWTDLTLENVDVPNNAETLKFTCFLFGPKDNSQIGDKAWFDDASLTIAPKLPKVRPSQPCQVGSPAC